MEMMQHNETWSYGEMKEDKEELLANNDSIEQILCLAKSGARIQIVEGKWSVFTKVVRLDSSNARDACKSHETDDITWGFQKNPDH